MRQVVERRHRLRVDAFGRRERRLERQAHERRDDRGRRNARVPGDGIARGVQPRLHADEARRPVKVVLHVFLAGPEHFHRRAFHGFGDGDALAHEVLRAAAPSEAAPQLHAVHLDVLERHAGGPRRGGEGRLRVLGGSPDGHPAVLDKRGAAHRLHGGVREVRRVVLRLELLRGGGEGLVEIAVLARRRDVLLRVEPRAIELHQARARDVAVRAHVPFDVDVAQRFLRPPPVVGDDCDESLQGYDLDDAAPALDLARVHRLQLAAEHRALRDRGVEHAGKLHVDAVALPA